MSFIRIVHTKHCIKPATPLAREWQAQAFSITHPVFALFHTRSLSTPFSLSLFTPPPSNFVWKVVRWSKRPLAPVNRKADARRTPALDHELEEVFRRALRASPSLPPLVHHDRPLALHIVIGEADLEQEKMQKKEGCMCRPWPSCFTPGWGFHNVRGGIDRGEQGHLSCEIEISRFIFLMFESCVQYLQYFDCARYGMTS